MPGWCPTGRQVRAGPPFQNDGLRLEEGQQSLGATFATYARLLEPPEGDAEVRAERVVADGAGAQLPSDVPGPLDVVGEDGCVEAVDRVVGDGDRLLLVLRGNHAEHRPEDLLLRDGRGVVDVAEDGGFDEPAPVEMLRSTATGGQRGSRRDALGDVALDAVSLTLGDQRPHLRLGVEGVAHPHLGERSGERLDELVVATLTDDDPGQRRADLTGEEALGAGQRAAAAPRSMSSRMTAADFPPSSRVQRAIRSPHKRGNATPGGGRAGEGDFVHAGVAHQELGHLPIRRHHVEHPGGRPTASAISAMT